MLLFQEFVMGDTQTLYMMVSSIGAVFFSREKNAMKNHKYWEVKVPRNFTLRDLHKARDEILGT
jgi:hypothetical protein